MGSADIVRAEPLVRLNPLYPGQLGVAGSSNSLGLRSAVGATKFYVSPNHPDANDNHDGVDPNHPLVTIAAALERCEDYRGDVIQVEHNGAWQFAQGISYTQAIEEFVTVTKHGVRITGVSNSPLGPVWRAPAGDALACEVLAMDVVIEGFCFVAADIDDSAAGVYFTWDGVDYWGDNGTVRHCYFDSSMGAGVGLSYAWNCDIHDNKFMGTTGVLLGGDGPAAYCRIYDNLFWSAGGAGRAIGGDIYASEIRCNRIYNETALMGQSATKEGINTSAGDGRNIIADNWLSCLLPDSADGDYDDFCAGGANDAWIGNHCIDGVAVAAPA